MSGEKAKERIDLAGIESKSFAVQVETYGLKYNELKEKAKNLRKEGKDPYIAELYIANFKAKMHIAEVTREQKDLNVVKDMLSDSEKELIEADAEKISDLRKEIEEGAKRLIEEDAKNR